MRVLVVEDDAALARGLVATLKLSGFAADHELSLPYPSPIVW